jgi:chemotaxis signal transduction protein
MQTMTTFDPESLRDPDRAQPKADAIKTNDYFVFRLHGRAYGVTPSCIESVAQMQRVVPVPTSGAHVSGIIHSRGRIIAVVSLGALLGIDDQAQLTESARLIVVSARYPFAFVADATLGIWACSVQTRNNDDGPMVTGRIDHSGEAATVIDPNAVIERVVSLRMERP